MRGVLLGVFLCLQPVAAREAADVSIPPLQSAVLTARDKAQISARIRRWARFAELPTSPALRSVLPELPRWLEVQMLDAIDFTPAAPKVHPASSLAPDSPITRTARCSLRLGVAGPAKTLTVPFTLDFAQVGGSWTLARVACAAAAEGVPTAVSSQRNWSEFYELAGTKGGPLPVYRFGTGPNVTLLFSAIHGDERNTAPLLTDLVEHLQKTPEDYQGSTVVVCPVLNPEGWARQTRQNGQGIDANRNFPFDFSTALKKDRYFPGQRSLQTPQALALQHLVQCYRPDRIVAVHCPLDLINYDGPAADLAEQMHQATGQPVSPSIGYPTPGSFGTYAGLYLGIPTITLELPETGDQWARQKEALLGLLRSK